MQATPALLVRVSSILWCWTLFGLLAALPAGNAEAQDFKLGVRVDLPSGAVPTSVLMADVSGDGKLDLVSANYNVNSLSVLLGNGTGGFAPRTDFTMGSNPVTVAAGDVNGDGKADLVTANYVSHNLSVRLGTGGGGFGARTDYPTGFNPFCVAIGDLSGDGKPDLAVANNGSASVSVLLGSGTGTFGARTDFTTGAGTYGVAIGDVNGDGRPDLVSANATPSTISVLLGDGAGGFGTRTDFATGANPYSVALGDVNEDGRLDVATANFTGNSVSVLLGNGAGGFGAKTDFATQAGPATVAIGDVGGDGKADLATGNYTAGSVSVLSGDGAGGFGPSTNFSTGAGSASESMAMGDVNGDGRVDLAVANSGANTISVLFGIGAGELRARTDYPTGAGSNHAVVADIDGDGTLDLVTANYSAHTISVLRGTGAGSFGAKTDFATGAGATNPSSVAVGDVNADGKPDLAVANAATNKVAVLINKSTPSMVSFYGPNEFAALLLPASVAMRDVTGDGKPDLVVANYNSNSVSLFVNATPPSSAVASFPTRNDFTMGSNPVAVAVLDVNNDGRPDVATANYISHNVSVRLATSASPFFGARTDFATGNGPYSVALADVSGDLKPDLVTANNGGPSVSVLLGNGTGGFGVKTDFPTTAGTQAVAIGDVNGDGRADVAVAGGGLSILHGNGAGSLGPKVDFTVGTSPYSVALADVDADGRLDAVTANFGAGTASVLLGFVPTQTAVVASPNPIDIESTVTLTATVTAPAGSGTPTGTVRFFDGTTLLGTAPLSGGTAGLTQPAAHLGDRVITAVYAGDATRFGSASAPTVLRVLRRRLSIDDVSVREGDAGTVNATFTVTLSSMSNQDVTVHYATTNESATTAGNDYVAASGTATIAAHTLSTTLTVTVNGDDVSEDDERFFFDLADPVDAILADNQGIGTIVNDDGGVLSNVLDLTWDQCPQVVFTGVNKSTACNGNDLDLYSGFRLPRTITNVTHMEIELIVATQSQVLPPFWHMETGGCHAGGLDFDHRLPDLCGIAGDTWGDDAMHGVFYEPHAAYHARIRAYIQPVTPVTLDAYTDYYGFNVRLDVDGAVESGGACEGCVTPACIRWNYDLHAGRRPVRPEGPAVLLRLRDAQLPVVRIVQRNHGRRSGVDAPPAA